MQCFKAKRFSWAVVEFIHRSFNLLCGDSCEITILRKYCRMRLLVFSFKPLFH